jgi:hypothetical protein
LLDAQPWLVVLILVALALLGPAFYWLWARRPGTMWLPRCLRVPLLACEPVQADVFTRHYAMDRRIHYMRQRAVIAVHEG